jgi:hypothetical protein
VVDGSVMSNDRVSRVWAQVARQSRGTTVSVAHVCTAVLAAVKVDGAGVTVKVSRTVRETVQATDAVAARLEELQLTSGEGPCVDTFDEGGPVLAVDLRFSEYLARWPAFAPAALDSGARAVFALPLQIGAIQLGVLDLYRFRPGGLSLYELADALAFADIVGMLLLGDAAGGPPDTAELTWQFEDPSSRNAFVHQATGMMLVQLGTSAATAFARLRAYAFAHNRRLNDVACDVVERRLRFDPDPHPDRRADDPS